MSERHLLFCWRWLWESNYWWTRCGIEKKTLSRRYWLDLIRFCLARNLPLRMHWFHEKKCPLPHSVGLPSSASCKFWESRNFRWNTLPISSSVTWSYITWPVHLMYAKGSHFSRDACRYPSVNYVKTLWSLGGKEPPLSLATCFRICVNVTSSGWNAT